MRDRKRKRIITVFIALVAMVSTYLPHLPILPAQQVFAQTPNTEVEAASKKCSGTKYLLREIIAVDDS